MAAVGIPTWILLLFLFPFSGLGPLLCLTGATLVTAAVVVWSERRRGRDAEDGGGQQEPDAPRAPMGALAGAGIAVGVVVLLVYVIFVIRAA
jgi:uncharacterized iron-regulated membrane protein